MRTVYELRVFYESKHPCECDSRSSALLKTCMGLLGDECVCVRAIAFPTANGPELAQNMSGVHLYTFAAHACHSDSLSFPATRIALCPETKFVDSEHIEIIQHFELRSVKLLCLLRLVNDLFNGSQR